MTDPAPQTPSDSSESEGESTRDRILRVAADAWHNSSFDGVGIAEICRLAEVHKGSFFHFFKSKQALLLAVLDAYASGLREQLRCSAFANDVAPLQRFERFFAGMAATVADEVESTGCMRGCPIGNLALELSTRNKDARSAAANAFDQVQAVFEDALRDAIADGELPPHNSAATAAAVLTWMQGLAVLGKTYGLTAQLQTLGSSAVAMIRALAAETAAE